MIIYIHPIDDNLPIKLQTHAHTHKHTHTRANPIDGMITEVRICVVGC